MKTSKIVIPIVIIIVLILAVYYHFIASKSVVSTDVPVATSTSGGLSGEGVVPIPTKIGVATSTPVTTSTPVATSTPTQGVGLGQHCGGFIKNAPVCATNLHCQLTISRPDTGGVCVAN
jgi:hypothetical protein